MTWPPSRRRSPAPSSTVEPRLTTVIGPAGVGKSRLLRAFLEGTADTAAALRGRCLSYGDGITFWPLAEIVREVAGIGYGDALEDARAKLEALLGPERSNVTQRIGAAIGLIDSVFPVEETFWAVARSVRDAGRRATAHRRGR